MHFIPQMTVTTPNSTGSHQPTHAPGVYERLMATPDGGCDSFDRHVLASALATAMAEHPRPLTEALGLTREMLAELLETAFPGAYAIDELVTSDDGEGENAIEEEDFRQLFLDHRTHGAAIEHWIAHIIVRRSLCPDHLWRNLGVRARSELSQTLYRHFHPLASRNVRDMRWKKFFYREMCQTEGIFICKSPVCDTCPDFNECFGPET